MVLTLVTVTAELVDASNYKLFHKTEYLLQQTQAV